MTREEFLDKITHVVIGYTTTDMPVYFDSDVPVFKKVMEIIDLYVSDLHKENNRLQSELNFTSESLKSITLISSGDAEKIFELGQRIEELEKRNQDDIVIQVNQETLIVEQRRRIEELESVIRGLQDPNMPPMEIAMSIKSYNLTP